MNEVVTQTVVAQGDASRIIQLAGHHNTIYVVAGRDEWRLVSSFALPAAGGALGPNPYRSLDAFDEQSSDLFFGRSALSQKLIGRLERLARANTGIDAPLRLLAIVGPSGCGKSSIARAGLVPAIAQSNVTSLRGAQVLVFHPGPHPLSSLAEILAHHVPTLSKAKVEADLRCAGETGYFSDLAQMVSPPGGIRRPVILIVDQFEELYTVARPLNRGDAAAGEASRLERSIFARTLLAAARAPDAGIFVVLTLRSDLYGLVAEHPDVSAAISASHELVAAMEAAELREAICKPAILRGLELRPEVVDSLVAQALENPSALPLVQHALFRFWNAWAASADPVAQAAAYAALSNLGGAMAATAHELMAELPSGQGRILAWRVLVRAVQFGEGVRDSKRRVAMSEVLPKGTSVDVLRASIAPFVRERLLSVGGEVSDPGSAWVEITHESLIANWTELRERLDRARPDEGFLRRAQEAATAWKQGAGGLWQGIDLDRLNRYAAANDVTENQAEFLAKSLQLLRNRRWTSRAFVALLAVLAVGAAFLYWQGRGTNEQLRAAVEGRDKALENAEAANKQAKSDATTALRERDAALQAESRAIARQARDLVEKQPVKAYLLAAQGVPWAAMGDSGHRPEVLDARYAYDIAASRLAAQPTELGPSQQVIGMSYKGDVLAVSPRTQDGTAGPRPAGVLALTLYRLGGGAQVVNIRDLGRITPSSAGASLRVVISPDATQALIQNARLASSTGTAVLVSLAGQPGVSGRASTEVPWDEGANLPRSLATIPPDAFHGAHFNGTTVTADGREAAVALREGGGVRRFWSEPTGWRDISPLSTPPFDPARTIRFSPDGSLLFGVSQLGNVFLWDLTSPSPELVTLRPTTEPVTSVALLDDRTQIAANATLVAATSTTLTYWTVADVLDRAKRDLQAEQSLSDKNELCMSRMDLMGYGLLQATPANVGDREQLIPQAAAPDRHGCPLAAGMRER